MKTNAEFNGALKTPATWKIPPLKTHERESLPEWRSPPIPEPSENTASANSWKIPAVPAVEPEQTEHTRAQPAFARLPRRRTSYLLVLLVIVIAVANREKIPGWWAELTSRKPAQEWVRGVALEKMPAAFGMGNLLSFQIERVTTIRELPGEAHVTVTGTATVREPLYEIVPFEDSALGLQTQVQSLKAASEHAATLRQRRGIDVSGPAVGEFTFLKQTTASGHTTQFEFVFKAGRIGTAWHLETVLGASLAPPGKPIASFPTNAAVLQTAEADRVKAELASKIDTFVAAVNDAENITKNSPVFPPDHAIAGERFSQTRMALLDATEIQNWSEDNLQYAINEIFARHGAEFRDKKLSRWFHQFNWYRPQPSLTFDQIEKWLPDTELQNMKSLGYVFLIKHEQTEKRQQAAAAQQRAATDQQQRAAAAQRGQQQAAQRAQQDAATAQAVSGLLQGIINSIPRR